MVNQLRQHLDHSGQDQMPLVIPVDGSFCNRTVFAQDWDPKKVSIVARCRKDIVLCPPSRGKGPRFYGKTKFTPQMARRRDSLAKWKKARIFHGGCYRVVRYKEISKIYWQGGAKKKMLRLLVVAPLGYRTSKNGRQYYRQAALVFGLSHPAAQPIGAQSGETSHRQGPGNLRNHGARCRRLAISVASRDLGGRLPGSKCPNSSARR